MIRRKFLKAAGLSVGGMLVAPYILPSGRLFAASGAPLANHVVYVLCAGGVRQQESVLQRYLDDSQGVPVAGNIMPNIMTGAAPTTKIVFGTTPVGQPAGSAPIPTILSSTLQQQGTLFPEMSFSKSGTGHYVGLTTILSGQYAAAQGLRVRPLAPTIFEYARRHLGLSATKTWFIGNGINNSTPLLNYSIDPDYGWEYGANFFAPNITFGQEGQDHLENAKIYHPEDELDPIYKMKAFLDNAYLASGITIENIKNTDEEKQDIKDFIRQMFIKKANGSIAFPPVSDNIDLSNVGYTCEVLKWFKPTLTVVNMSSVDGCHSNFTGYLGSLHRADHAVAHVWDYINKNIPEMAGKTAIIAIPEHGRNLNQNPILDENYWGAYDHSSDANARRVWGIMAGPGIDANLVKGSEGNPIGDSTDCVPTIAEILGFKNDVINAGKLDVNAKSLFDRL